MGKNKIVFNYVLLMIVISQTPWGRYVIFLTIPLFFYSLIDVLKSKKQTFKIIKPLFYILILGFIVGVVQFLYGNNTYYFLRDLLYFSQAPIYLIIGVSLTKNKLEYKKLLKLIVIVQFFVVIYGLIEIILNPSLLFQLNLQETYKLGLKFTSAVLAFAILYYCKKNKIHLFSIFQEKFLMYFFLLSILISLSRTSYVLVIFTIFIPLLGKKRIYNKIFWGSIAITLFVIFGGLFFQSNVENNYGTTFIDKAKGSFREVTIKDYETAAEINNNWRGYEGYLGLSKYYEGNEFELIFGQGFGAVANSPYWLFKGEKLEIIPIFHNGFITILLKTGIVGLLIFYIFLNGVIKKGMLFIKFKWNNYQFLAGQLLVLLTFMILFRTLVIHGVYRTTVDLSLILILGASLNFFETQVKLSGKIIR